MRILRFAGAAALAALLLYALCYVPYKCNVEARTLEARTSAAVQANNPVRAASLGHANLDQALPLVELCRCQVDVYMIAAANESVVGQSENAIALYRRALSMDRRPELYLSLADAEFAAGRVDDAVSHYAAAIAFDPNLKWESPPQLWKQIFAFLTNSSNLARVANAPQG